jgi:hypothetical protein
LPDHLDRLSGDPFTLLWGVSIAESGYQISEGHPPAAPIKIENRPTDGPGDPTQKRQWKQRNYSDGYCETNKFEPVTDLLRHLILGGADIGNCQPLSAVVNNQRSINPRMSGARPYRSPIRGTSAVVRRFVESL